MIDDINVSSIVGEKQLFPVEQTRGLLTASERSMDEDDVKRQQVSGWM
jgi:hypothetical protein